jgi:hypothetical protein
MADNGWIPSDRRREPAVLGRPIVDPAAWQPEEMTESEKWVYRLSPAEIAEIDKAIARVEDHDIALLDVGRDDFVLPELEASLQEMRDEVMLGRGFALLRGLPVARMTRQQQAIAYWGICQHFGEPVAQNVRGHLLGHVKDLGGDYEKVRGYMTRATMDFHCDSADILALGCLQPAKSGGEHRICSSVSLYNALLEERPDLVAELGFRFYRTRQGAIPPGENDPWMRQAVFSVADGCFAARGVSAGIRKAQKLEGVPKLTKKQTEALQAFKDMAAAQSFAVHFEVGDISFVCNHTTLHARSAFEDFPEPERKRHLLRMWISNGLRPVHEDIERRIRGVHVPSGKLAAPLDVA